MTTVLQDRRNMLSPYNRGATCVCMTLLLYNYSNAQVASHTETVVQCHGNRKQAYWGDARMHIRAVATNNDSSHITCCSLVQSHFLRNCTPLHSSRMSRSKTQQNEAQQHLCIHRHDGRPSSYMGRRCAAELVVWPRSALLSRTRGASHTPTFLNTKSISSISIMKIPQRMGNSSLTTYLPLLLRILHTI